MLFLAAAVLVAPLHFHVDATEFVNAVYHTACLTGRVLCSREVYTRFWNERNHVTPEDGARFDEFGRIFDELEAAAKPGPPSPFLPNDGSFFTPLTVRQRLVAASLASKSPSDLRAKLFPLAGTEKAARLADIVEHVRQRLRPWWLSTGRAIVKQQLPGIERRFRTLGVPALASEVAAMLETAPGFHDYYLHAVPSPDYRGETATGTNVSNHFPVEIVHKMEPEDLTWIAVHEFTHSVYGEAPKDRKDTLMRQFAASDDASAHAFYLYMNEALATAVQLLLYERNGKSTQHPYNDAYIPRLAKAALPPLRTALAGRRTLYDGFANAYLAAARPALGEDADSLQFRFGVAAVIGEDQVRHAFLEQAVVQYHVTSQQDWSRYSRLDGILLLRYEQVHFEGDDAPLVQSLQKQHRGFVYLRRKDEHMEAFLLGRDNAAIKELGAWWSKSKERPREGVLFTLE